MNPREINFLLHKVASFIEAHPDQYRFTNCEVPCNDVGDRGCLLGWAGHFMDRNIDDLEEVAATLGFIDSGDFYQKMHYYCAKIRGEDEINCGAWMATATYAGPALRELANSLFPTGAPANKAGECHGSAFFTD